MDPLTSPSRVGDRGTAPDGNQGDTAPDRSRRRTSSDGRGGRNQWIAWGVGGGALIVFVLAAIVVYESAFCCSGAAGGATEAGLAYARAQMLWLQGPTVQSSHTVPLRRLEGTLKQSVSLRVQADVNASDLVRRYGPNREVTLVVLTGEYNSLPPDEGVNMHGDVVVVVDARTDRVLLLMD